MIILGSFHCYILMNKCVFNLLCTQILKQVQPRLEIDEEALVYLESLIFKLLAQMCAAQPHTSADVTSYVQKSFPTPINTWALSDAEMLMERAQKKKVLFVFPVDKMLPALQKVTSQLAKSLYSNMLGDHYSTLCLCNNLAFPVRLVPSSLCTVSL